MCEVIGDVINYYVLSIVNKTSKRLRGKKEPLFCLNMHQKLPRTIIEARHESTQQEALTPFALYGLYDQNTKKIIYTVNMRRWHTAGYTVHSMSAW